MSGCGGEEARLGVGDLARLFEYGDMRRETAEVHARRFVGGGGASRAPPSLPPPPSRARILYCTVQ